MRLSDGTYEVIKQAVADMFVDYDVKGVPLCSFEVATKIGMTVIPYSALDSAMLQMAVGYSVDGFSIETKEGEWIIYYNDEDKDYSRINQAIMHEIAHFVLGHIEEVQVNKRLPDPRLLSHGQSCPPAPFNRI